MKKFLIQFVLLLTVIFGATFIYQGKSLPFSFQLQQLPKSQQVIIGDTKVNVEIADTKDERSKGLGGKESLASDSGMLFIFDRQDFYSFWMKGLKFPLDFIWIRGDKVVDITENVPVPSEGAKDEDLPIYQSKEPIDKLLEVNGGFVIQNGIKIGDTFNR
ncbi:MAG: DUF192 domain-containing protein [Patescibacteria group bacterium]